MIKKNRVLSNLCIKERPVACQPEEVQLCKTLHKSDVRYFRVCGVCPNFYPWTGKTGIANENLESYIDSQEWKLPFTSIMITWSQISWVIIPWSWCTIMNLALALWNTGMKYVRIHEIDSELFRWNESKYVCKISMLLWKKNNGKLIVFMTFNSSLHCTLKNRPLELS